MINKGNGTEQQMNAPNFNVEKYLLAGTKSAKDYVLLIRNNFRLLLYISVVIVFISIVYAFLARSIYKSAVTVKIMQPDKNVLEDTHDNLDTDYLDRYISNEIKIINNYSTIEKISAALIDSFNNSKVKSNFYLVKSKKNDSDNGHKNINQLAGLLSSAIFVEQNPGSDIIEISAESPSPFEAALIANTTANEYKKINLAISRDKLTNVRKFLEKQAQDRSIELKNAEDSLAKFQEQGGIVSLDIQSTGLISQLSQLDTQIEATKVELSTSNEVLKQYKYFLEKQNPQLVDYLENQTSQAYINALQLQLAELQVNRDLALSIKNPNIDVSSKVKDYDQRIAELQQKLSSTIGIIKAEAFSGNPDQVRDLAQRLIEEQIKNSTLSVRLEQLKSAAGKYENSLRRLPKTSTELSQYQRNREELQHLYSLVNEKYQEAMINELSQSGNAFVINPAVIPDTPEKPNRKLIILFGIILGPMVSFGYILIKDHFDETIKTPDDIEKKDIKFLSWVPHLDLSGNTLYGNNELVSLYEQNTHISESFRTIKSRIQHTRTELETPYTILVTSSAESEGKTFVSINLADSFAQSNKKTLVIDCDLRRPRIQSVFGVDKIPGLTDYFYHDVKMNDIIRKSKINNLSYITAGTIPSNPAEILESQLMKNFLKQIRDSFDVILLDSPPIIAVIDAEILSKLVDGTILVISADKTENRLMIDAIDLIKRNNSRFLGTVLNNFKYKSGYGYYYKYYYNYSSSSNHRGKKNYKLKS